MAGHGQQGLLGPHMTNSLAIRQEIQRFESVHPSIYAIYDLIELVPDPMLAQQIREHVVCIEGGGVSIQKLKFTNVKHLFLGSHHQNFNTLI